MANYSRPDFSPVPKGDPRIVAKQAREALVETQDKKERAKCRARSKGRCEVYRAYVGPSGYVFSRCLHPARENHHLIGGSGRRNKGKSILAEHRLDVCEKCHYDITNKLLVPVDGTKKEHAATVRYARWEPK